MAESENPVINGYGCCLEAMRCHRHQARLRCRTCLFCQSCSSKHLRTVPRHFISMCCARLALLHLICCLLLLHASSRTIKQIDVPALFKRHSADAELGNALRELKSRILRQGDSEDHLEFAVQLYKLGRATDALSEFRGLVAHNPADAHALHWLGRCLVQVNELDEGLSVLQRALRAMPSLHDAWSKLAAVLFEMREYDASARAFLIAARLTRASMMYVSAAHVLSSADSKRSLPMYLLALGADRANVAAWTDLSVNAGKAGKHKLAQWAAMGNLAINPTADAHFLAANTYMGTRQLDDAIRHFRLSGDTGDSLHNLAFAFRLNGQSKEGVSAALKALAVQRKTDAGVKAMSVSLLSQCLRSCGNFHLSFSLMSTMRQPPIDANVKLILNDHLTVRTDELVAAERQVRKWLKDGAINDPPIAAISEAAEVLVPKSIVLYMIGTKPEHYIDLVDSLTVLHRYYLSRWGYGVLVMHEGLTLAQMQRLSDIYPLTSFYLLNLTFPPHINASSVSYQVAGHASVGYRHMCRFYSGSIFTADVMLQYDWYWRVDSDSFILGPLQHDPIRELADGGSIYGYMALGREDEYLTTGLWAATQKHIKERRVRPTYLKQLVAPSVAFIFEASPFSQQFSGPDGSWDRSYYYTNFEIVYMPFFRGQQYQAFFQDLDSTEGFYAHRWGDAPIRLLGLAMYAQQQQVKLLDLPYSHKVYVNVASLTAASHQAL